jgi:hypothetical protein
MITKVKKHLKHHGTYHSGLFLFLFLGIVLAYYAKENKQLEMILMIGMASGYIIWGVIHHYLIHDLTSKIVIEYIALASLGLTIALFLVKGFAL